MLLWRILGLVSLKSVGMSDSVFSSSRNFAAAGPAQGVRVDNKAELACMKKCDNAKLCF